MQEELQVLLDQGQEGLPQGILQEGVNKNSKIILGMSNFFC